MCTTRFLYYFSVYVNLLKELLSFVANRRISGKRVQRYRLLQYLPNISPTFFLFFIIAVCKHRQAKDFCATVRGLQHTDRRML